MTIPSRTGEMARRLVAQPRRFVVVESVVLTLLIGLLDVATGAELSFSIFYLLPITLVAWSMERPWALGNAVMASITWLAADQLSGSVYSNPLLPYWNASIRLGYFVLFAVLFGRLRQTLERERTLSRNDPLTGLYNRRAFEELATRDVERASRYGRPISIAFIDLDHFKETNDQFGHDAGDALLRQVALTLVASLRSTDVVARMGGDEYAIVMPETVEDHARIALEKTRAVLAQRMTEHGWPVTFSIGVVSTTGEAASLPALLAAADRLMYEAKRAGRDRMVVAQYATMRGD